MKQVCVTYKLVLSLQKKNEIFVSIKIPTIFLFFSEYRFYNKVLPLCIQVGTDPEFQARGPAISEKKNLNKHSYSVNKTINQDKYTNQCFLIY